MMPNSNTNPKIVPKKKMAIVMTFKLLYEYISLKNSFSDVMKKNDAAEGVVSDSFILCF